MYKIKDFSRLAKTTTKTLRYYDKIGLLSPAFIDNNSYRMYSQFQLKLIKQIRFYKSLGFTLNEIKVLLSQDDSSLLESLVIKNVELDKTIRSYQSCKANLESLIKTINNKEEVQMNKEVTFIDSYDEEVHDYPFNDHLPLDNFNFNTIVYDRDALAECFDTLKLNVKIFDEISNSLDEHFLIDLESNFEDYQLQLREDFLDAQVIIEFLLDNYEPEDEQTCTH